jgi:hypothetical protein
MTDPESRNFSLHTVREHHSSTLTLSSRCSPTPTACLPHSVRLSTRWSRLDSSHPATTRSDSAVRSPNRQATLPGSAGASGCRKTPRARSTGPDKSSVRTSLCGWSDAIGGAAHDPVYLRLGSDKPRARRKRAWLTVRASPGRAPAKTRGPAHRLPRDFCHDRDAPGVGPVNDPPGDCAYRQAHEVVLAAEEGEALVPDHQHQPDPPFAGRTLRCSASCGRVHGCIPGERVDCSRCLYRQAPAGDATFLAHLPANPCALLDSITSQPTGFRRAPSRRSDSARAGI